MMQAKVGPTMEPGNGLSYTSRPEIDVVRRLIVLFVAFDSLVVHDAMKVMESADAFEATEFSPLVVGRYSMLSSSLDVQRGQIQSPFLARLLEQMVGHFLRHGVVQSLCHLVDHAHHIAVCPSTLV